LALTINSNISAHWAQESVRSSGQKLSTAMERLSTGVRINGAKDDAAGLAISTRMTAEIRGLNQALSNINNGINLLQTAEGSLNSITEMMQRIRELAVQAANSTYSDEQRSFIQSESNALQSEINRVVDTTNWNKIKLLDGSFTSQNIQVGANTGQSINISIPSINQFNTTTTVTDNAVFVVGYTSGDYDGITNAGLTDAYLTKYSSNGTKLWSRLIGSTGNEEAGGVTVSSDGLITVTGRTTGNLDGNVKSGPADIFITQFNQDGQKLWTKLIGGSTGQDVGNSITTDVNGSILLAGQTQSSFDGQTIAAAEDGVVIKLNPDGTKQWTRILGSTSSGSSYSVATSQDGSSYVAGYSNFQGSLTKYAADGTKIWQNAVDASHVLNFAGNAVYSVATSSDGSVYITGPKLGNLDGQTSNGSNDTFVIKYAADGTKLWTKLLGTVGSDAGYGIQVAVDGSVYVASETGSQSGADNARLTKLNANGDVIWSQAIQGAAGTTTGARKLTITPDGSVYMTGYTTGNLQDQNTIGARDIYLTKFSASGSQLWTRINGSTAADEPTGIASFSFPTTVTLPASSNTTLNLATQSGASNAIAALDSRINQVSFTRAILGSYINRLSSTIEVVMNAMSNLSASRSRILDTDYAVETSSLARNQIIQQAATAMLVQANQSKQSVMALLRS
jgi:flagellin-like hook-associated protein FlgL